MSLEELLKQRLLAPHDASLTEVNQLLALAHRDLTIAQTLPPADLDWACNVFYNAMLSSGRDLMFQKGYRSRGLGWHRTVLRSCAYYLDSDYKRYIGLMDQMHRKRHRLVYEHTDLDISCSGKSARIRNPSRGANRKEDCVRRSARLQTHLVIRGNGLR